MNRKTLGFFATTALVVLTSAAKAEITFDQNSAEEYCTETWTKRGVLDSEAYDYCMEQQTDGFEEAQALYQKYKNEDHIEMIDDIVEGALATYAQVGHNDYQFDIVAYVIKSYSEAYLNVQYDVNSGKYTQAQLDYCKDDFLKPKEGDWTMVEFCLKLLK